VRERARTPTSSEAFSQDGITFEVRTDAVAAIVDDFDPAVSSYNAARDRFRSAYQQLVVEAYAAAARRRGAPPRALSPDVRAQVSRAQDRIWPAITAPEFLRQLLSSEERIERAAAGILFGGRTSNPFQEARREVG